MRIIDLNIESFGLFQDVTVDHLDEPIVCFSGPNEAGKSTLFRFVQTMFYGIHPVDPAKNPDVPFGGRFMQGGLRYKLEDGSVTGVLRRLRSTADGELIREDLFGHAHKIRNQPLPDVSHVTRRVFEHVYSMRLVDLTRFEESTFREIQDRLLGSLNAPDIRSAAAVMAELDAEAKALWRPDRAGKPTAKVLAESRRTLQDELASARTKHSDGRVLEARAAGLELRLGECRVEECEVRELLAAVQNENDVVTRRRELERLRELASASQTMLDLPENPLDRLEGLRAEVEKLRDELSKLTDTAASLHVLNEPELSRLRDVVAAEDEIRVALAVHDTARTALAGGVRESASIRAESAWFESARKSVFSSPCPVATVAAIDIDAVHHTIARHDVLMAEVSDAKAKLAGSRRRQKIYALLGAVGLFGLFNAVLGGPAVLIVGGVAIVLLASGGVMVEKRHRDEVGRTLSHRVHETDLSRAQIHGLLHGVTVRDELFDRSRTEFASRLSDLVAVAVRIIQRGETDGRLAGDHRRAAEQLAALGRRFGVWSAFGPDDESTGARLRSSLERLLREASAALRTHDEDTEKAQTNKARREVIETRMVGLERSIQALEVRLSELGEGRVEIGADRLLESRMAARQATLLTEQLAAAGIDVKAGGAATDTEPGNVVSLQRRLESLEEESAASRREQLEVHAALGAVRKERRVDEVQSELEDVDLELERVRCAHDRLRVLEGIVRIADQRFREAHQPDVIARTNRYLQQITGGRYQRILVDEKIGSVDIVKRGETQARPLDTAVSQGTRDQVYLALRLALADHLDADRERLPIFLDEVFVTWDPERRMRAYDILSELSKQRQVFLLTCHAWLEEEARMKMDARIVSLSHVNV